jgi:steroid delta-isomerase-like uncharacterized protein
MSVHAEFGARWLAAWNDHSPQDVAALCTDDVVYVDPVRPEPLQGRAAVQEFAASLLRAFPDLRVEAEHDPFVSLAGGRAIVPVRVCGVMSGPLEPPGFGATGGPVVIEAHYGWELRDGLARRFRALYDVHEIARQIGAGPPPGSGIERMGIRLQRVTARRLRRQNRRSA